MKPPKSLSLITVLIILLGYTELAQAMYNPETGSFLSRDPIEERGGQNLYGFVRNDAVGRIDRLGMHDFDSDQKFRKDYGNGQFRGGGDGEYWQESWGVADPEMVAAKHVARISVNLSWPSVGEKCGDYVYLDLEIYTGNIKTTEMYFDPDRTQFISKVSARDQIVSENVINYNRVKGDDYYRVQWKIPTEKDDSNPACCRVAWSKEGYNLSYSSNGDEASETPPGQKPYTPPVPQWFVGVEIYNSVVLEADDQGSITFAMGGVTLGRWGRAPNDPDTAN